ncbi:MAG: hemolysin family protein [Gemmataceae bacterium]
MFAAADGDGLSLGWTVFSLMLVPALVLLNGLFVAAEFALVSVRKTRVEEMEKNGVAGAKAVLEAIGSLDNSIAATQLGITLASIGLGFVGEPALAHLIRPLFRGLPEGWAGVTTHSVASAVAFCVITYLHVVFGELIPKSVALQLPDRAALWLARPLLIFGHVSRPVIKAMNGTGNALLRVAGLHGATGESMVHSVEELLLLIEDTEEAGVLDADQADLVENIFRLSDKRVADCMVPREKMASLELSTPPEVALEAVRNGAHTRMPVYEGEVDNVVGIVNTKDLFYLFSLRGVVVLSDALYPAIFLKPDETVANALRLFKRSHRHMALVRDDDGKISGLLTLEDVLEEIVGDIEDEHDRPTPRLKLIRKARRASPLRPGGSGTFRALPERRAE